jgi:hypothetical protein
MKDEERKSESRWGAPLYVIPNVCKVVFACLLLSPPFSYPSSYCYSFVSSHVSLETDILIPSDLQFYAQSIYNPYPVEPLAS